MKKFFGRDKSRVKVVPSDIGSGLPPDSYSTGPHSLHDQSRSGTPNQSEEHWSFDAHTVRSNISTSPLLPASTPASLVSAPHAPSSGSPAPLPSSPLPLLKARLSDRERTHPIPRKKVPNGHSAFAAVGILKALEPHSEIPHTPETLDDGLMEAALHEDKREKRGFWERTSVRDKDKEKDRDKDKEKDRMRQKERKDEDAPAELTRMIGYLTATSSEDWSLVLEVCDRASSSEINAKEAVKALRREFKYAEPSAQLSAARLWAIMLHNCSRTFISQCASRKFVDTLEEVLNSSRTSPVVRERLLEVLAAAVYGSPTGKDSALRSLWRKVKPADKPEEGAPFDTGDAMFYPPTPHRPQSQLASDQPRVRSERGHSTVLATQPKPAARDMVIPLEEDMRRLFQECKVGRGNAALLSEALAFARPEDLKLKELIKEFYARCRASQELISAQIPWAFAGAERSRQASDRGDKRFTMRSSIDSVPKRSRVDSDISRTTSEEGGSTQEEQLLAALLAANEDLMEALRLYDDLERVGMEREAEERSKKETRIDRTQLSHGDWDASYLEPGYSSRHLASSSRSASPSSPSLSPAPSFIITPVVQPHTHPLPPLPPHGSVNYTHQAIPVAHQGSIQSLAPPPHAPLGPRSPASTPRSRTPSPDRSSVHHFAGSRSSSDSNPSRISLEISQLHQRESIGVAEESGLPPRPSEKALGKRKIVDSGPNSLDPNMTLHDHPDEASRLTEDGLDSDSEDGLRGAWHQPVHYVYDAAAERTQQLIQEGRLAVAALVGNVH